MSRSHPAGEKKRFGGGGVLLIALGIIFLLSLPFVPLLLALIEHLMFGSDHVEQFCKTIGIHDLLSELYKPLLNVLKVFF